MTFTPIDRETWERKAYFDHYFSQVPCTYSAVFSLDITSLLQRCEKLYPAMLYAIATIQPAPGISYSHQSPGPAGFLPGNAPMLHRLSQRR